MHSLLRDVHGRRTRATQQARQWLVRPEMMPGLQQTKAAGNKQRVTLSHVRWRRDQRQPPLSFYNTEEDLHTRRDAARAAAVPYGTGMVAPLYAVTDSA